MFPAYSQDTTRTASATGGNEIRTLFHPSDNPVKMGFFIGPECSYTQFDGRDVFLGGLSLGAIVNHWFAIGLGGYGILNSGNLWYSNIYNADTVGAYLYGGYGGLKLEFRLWPEAPVHITFPLLIGGGGLVYNNWVYNTPYHESYDGTTLDSDGFFVIEPGIMVEANIVKFMRIGVGGTYRYAAGLNLMNTSKNLVNTFNLNLSLRFGKF